LTRSILVDILTAVNTIDCHGQPELS